MIGAVAMVLVALTPLLNYFLTGKGEGAGLLASCLSFPLLIGAMIAGVSSGIRSLWEGPPRLVAITGIVINLLPIWALPLLARLTQ